MTGQKPATEPLCMEILGSGKVCNRSLSHKIHSPIGGHAFRPAPVAPEPARNTFKCKARSANMGANDPQDCGWPNCDCDPTVNIAKAPLECIPGCRLPEGHTEDCVAAAAKPPDDLKLRCEMVVAHKAGQLFTADQLANLIWAELQGAVAEAEAAQEEADRKAFEDWFSAEFPQGYVAGWFKAKSWATWQAALAHRGGKK